MSESHRNMASDSSASILDDAKTAGLPAHVAALVVEAALEIQRPPLAPPPVAPAPSVRLSNPQWGPVAGAVSPLPPPVIEEKVAERRQAVPPLMLDVARLVPQSPASSVGRRSKAATEPLAPRKRAPRQTRPSSVTSESVEFVSTDTAYRRNVRLGFYITPQNLEELNKSNCAGLIFGLPPRQAPLDPAFCPFFRAVHRAAINIWGVSADKPFEPEDPSVNAPPTKRRYLSLGPLAGSGSWKSELMYKANPSGVRFTLSDNQAWSVAAHYHTPMGSDGEPLPAPRVLAELLKGLFVVEWGTGDTRESPFVRVQSLNVMPSVRAWAFSAHGQTEWYVADASKDICFSLPEQTYHELRAWVSCQPRNDSTWRDLIQYTRRRLISMKVQNVETIIPTLAEMAFTAGVGAELQSYARLQSSRSFWENLPIGPQAFRPEAYTYDARSASLLAVVFAVLQPSLGFAWTLAMQSLATTLVLSGGAVSYRTLRQGIVATAWITALLLATFTLLPEDSMRYHPTLVSFALWFILGRHDPRGDWAKPWAEWIPRGNLAGAWGLTGFWCVVSVFAEEAISNWNDLAWVVLVSLEVSLTSHPGTLGIHLVTWIIRMVDWRLALVFHLVWDFWGFWRSPPAQLVKVIAWPPAEYPNAALRLPQGLYVPPEAWRRVVFPTVEIDEPAREAMRRLVRNRTKRGPKHWSFREVLEQGPRGPVLSALSKLHSRVPRTNDLPPEVGNVIVARGYSLADDSAIEGNLDRVPLRGGVGMPFWQIGWCIPTVLPRVCASTAYNQCAGLVMRMAMPIEFEPEIVASFAMFYPMFLVLLHRKAGLVAPEEFRERRWHSRVQAVEEQDFEEWNAKFPRARAEAQAEARRVGLPEDLSDVCERTMFIKREALPQVFTGGSKPLKPRVIISGSNAFNAFAGPWFSAASKRVAELCHAQRGCGWVYTISMRDSDLGLWCQHSLDRGFTFAIWNDMSAYDGTQTLLSRLMQLRADREVFGMPDVVHSLMLTRFYEAEGHSRQGLRFVYAGRRDSGEPDTSRGNTLLNMASLSYAMAAAVLGTTDADECIGWVDENWSRFSGLVLGDDNYALFGHDLWKLIVAKAGEVDSVLRKLGLKPKLNFGEWWQGDFCSALFWPLKMNGRETVCLAPKIGRVLAKGGFTVQNLPRGAERAWLAGIASSLGRTWGAVPILRAIRVLLERIHGPVLEHPTMWALEDPEDEFTVSDHVWRFISDRYGLRRQDVEQAEALILATPSFPCVWSHWVLDEFVRVDVESDGLDL